MNTSIAASNKNLSQFEDASFVISGESNPLIPVISYLEQSLAISGTVLNVHGTDLPCFDALMRAQQLAKMALAEAKNQRGII